MCGLRCDHAIQVCADAKQALAILGALSGDGCQVVRLKNFFRDLDETHYRRLQCVVMVMVDDYLHHLVEVQIHLGSIYKFRNHNLKLCREPFEYFRKVFKGGTLKEALRGSVKNGTAWDEPGMQRLG